MTSPPPPPSPGLTSAPPSSSVIKTIVRSGGGLSYSVDLNLTACSPQWLNQFEQHLVTLGRQARSQSQLSTINHPAVLIISQDTSLQYFSLFTFGNENTKKITINVKIYVATLIRRASSIRNIHYVDNQTNRDTAPALWLYYHILQANCIQLDFQQCHGKLRIREL